MIIRKWTLTTALAAAFLGACCHTAQAEEYQSTTTINVHKNHFNGNTVLVQIFYITDGVGRIEASSNQPGPRGVRGIGYSHKLANLGPNKAHNRNGALATLNPVFASSSGPNHYSFVIRAISSHPIEILGWGIVRQ